MRSMSGTAATKATQPMATYRPDHSGCFSRSSSIAPTPMAAADHTMANSDQPHAPLSTPSAKGM